MPKNRPLMSWATILAIVSFVGLGIVVYERYEQVVGQIELLTVAQTTVGATNSLISLLKDTESSVRGFVITGDDQYLDPYRQAVAAVPAQLVRLRTSLPADQSLMAQADAFTALIDRKLSVLRQVIDARRSGTFDDARALLFRLDDKGTMDHARAAADSLAASARQVVIRQRDANQRSVRLTRAWMAGTFIVGIVMLMLSGTLVRRELRRRVRADAALQAAYQEVEGRVQSRTAELTAANAHLAASERRFKAIAELSPAFLFTAQPDGMIDFISPGVAGLDLSGHVLADRWIQAVHIEDRERVTRLWEHAVRTKSEFDANYRLQVAEGEYRWFASRAKPLIGEDGEVVQWVGAAIDIHDQHEAHAVRAEALKREQQARAMAEGDSQLKDEFLATVSHELRTPLNAMIGWLHLLKSGAGVDRHHAIEVIERNAFAQVRLIDDILDVSRMIKGRFTLSLTKVDLRATVESAIGTISPGTAAKGITVRLTATGDVTMLADETRLQQVVWNLLSNAAKFTPKGGRIDVDVSQAVGLARITVTDTGEGIDPAFLPHLFEPFRQGSSRSGRTGLGLGLAIASQIVELHGGTLTAESPGPNQGSTFTVSLPVERAAMALPIQASRPAGVSLGGVRVLIAEDDEDSATMLTSLLEQRGCDVKSSGTAAGFLAMLSTWRPDLLLCDIGLPDDDGYSLLRRARGAYPPAIPAIALTAYVREQDRARSLAAGFAAHMGKPFDPDVLVDQIAGAVGRRAS